MARAVTERERRLRAAAVLCAILFLGDLIILVIVGEIPSALWLLAVPVGLLLVPLAGVACLAMLLWERRRP